MAPKQDHVVGSGNVFADLGYARPEAAAAKAELAHRITKIIERRKLTQAQAANILEVDQGDRCEGTGPSCQTPRKTACPVVSSGASASRS